LTKRRKALETSAELLNFARCARRRRNDIRQEIEPLGQLSDIAVHFSNPAFSSKLLFPFVGPVVPTRFSLDNEEKWFYMGREKFIELRNNLTDKKWRRNRSALWLYGTKGYGKSHLLAALIYYLSATKARVVYIPDCRECLKEPIPYIQVAMLFAWSDDENLQREIVGLNTYEEINHFFKRGKNVIFIIDQVNGLAQSEKDDNNTAMEKGALRRWLTKFRTGHKAILSTSANYRAYLQQSIKQTTEDTMHVYGGLTPVSLNSNRG
jgi:hypothetical protein